MHVSTNKGSIKLIRLVGYPHVSLKLNKAIDLTTKLDNLSSKLTKESILKIEHRPKTLCHS